MPKFGSIQVKNMVAVGAATARSARLWFRTEVAGRHELAVWPRDRPNRVARVGVDVPADNDCDNTYSVTFPDDFAGQAALLPQNNYRFKVTRVADETPLGEGSFTTSPANPADTPAKYSIALMSCHQPFNSDGDMSERAVRMLRLVPRVLSDHQAKYVLMCGDQIYADAPGDFSLLNPHYFSTKVLPSRKSLLEATAAEVRRAYQERYRTFWSMNELRHVYANYPCYPILDDHEIVDDWGSLPVHNSKTYANVFRGAREAYFDYQGSRVANRQARLPRSLHYSFEWGSLATFVMDLRSERRVGVGNGLYGKGQENALRRFLLQHADKRVLVIVASVPVIHLPSWLADIGHSIVGNHVDFADHWSYAKNRPARDTLLRMLHDHQQQHPKQRVVLASGDVHIGCAFAIHWKGGTKPILYQFTSSAVSNRLKQTTAYFSGLGPKLASNIDCGDDSPEARVNLIKPRKAEYHAENNPFGGLNIGIIEVSDNGDHSNVNFKLIGYPPDEQWDHREMFQTGPL